MCLAFELFKNAEVNSQTNKLRVRVQQPFSEITGRKEESNFIIQRAAKTNGNVRYECLNLSEYPEFNELLLLG